MSEVFGFFATYLCVSVLCAMLIHWRNLARKSYSPLPTLITACLVIPVAPTILAYGVSTVLPEDISGTVGSPIVAAIISFAAVALLNWLVYGYWWKPTPNSPVQTSLPPTPERGGAEEVPSVVV